MALFASRRQTERDMVWRRRLFEVSLVTGIARRGHGLKLAVGSVLVAGIAIDGGVGAGQGEPVIVLLNFLDRYAPPAHAVALLAIGSQLALMNVGVAILAASAHIAEHHLDVALDASHILVQAPQRITSLVVIEFGNRTDRLPPLRRVAVLTGNIQVAMWAIRTRSALVRRARKRAGEQ